MVNQRIGGKMIKATIANINIEAHLDNSIVLEKQFEKYQNKTIDKTDLIIKSVICEEIKVPEGTFVQKVNDITIIQISKDEYCRFLRSKDTGKVLFLIFYNKDYSEIEIRLLKSRENPYMTLDDFQYMYTGFAFSNKLLETGGVILHGSAISIDGQGIIFSANSGIGKSTHTRLWKDKFGDRVIHVNDDKPAIRLIDDIPIMFGTPWSGKNILNMNKQVPIKAIVFIRRAEVNSIERLNLRDSILYLSSQIYRPYYDEGISVKAIDIIENLVEAVPVYMLNCNVSQEAVNVVYKTIIEEGTH